MQRTTATSEHLLAEAAGELERAFGILIPPHRWPELELGLVASTSRSLHEAVHLLRNDPVLRRRLIGRVAIPETYFFRHFPHFTALADLAQRRWRHGRPCRVLSAGCSTGEEVWSAAAVVANVYLPQSRDFEIEGWDLDPERLRLAERAEYGHWSVRGGLHGYDGYFRSSAGSWRPNDRLREFVRFRAANLVEESLPPGPTYDAILFRNVAIYWQPERVRRVTASLFARLAPDGVLLLGPCDPLPPPEEGWQLQLVDSAPVYRRLGELTPPEPPTSALWFSESTAPCPRGADLEHSLPDSMGSAAPFRASTGDEDIPAATPSTAAEEITFLADAGCYEEALERARKEPRPWPAALRGLMGILLLNLDRPAEALESFRQAVYLAPEENDWRRWLAVALDSVGRSGDAERERRNAGGR